MYLLEYIQVYHMPEWRIGHHHATQTRRESSTAAVALDMATTLAAAAIAAADAVAVVARDVPFARQATPPLRVVDSARRRRHRALAAPADGQWRASTARHDETPPYQAAIATTREV